MGGKSFGGRRIDRGEVESLVESLKASLALSDIPTQIAGSYRREKADSGDVDLVFIPHEKDVERVKITLKSTFGRLKTKDEPQMAGLYDGVQFDFHLTRLTCLGSMMLHATGSWQFNKFMRTRAMSAGYKLNQYGLFDRGTNEPVLQSSDEAPFFRVLKMEFVPPVDRSSGRQFFAESWSTGQQVKYELTEDAWKVVE